MGPLILAGLLAVSSPVHADEGVQAWLVAVDGDAFAGNDVTVEVALADDQGAPYTLRAPQLRPVDGELTEPPRPRSPGRWLARWHIPENVPANSRVRARVLVGRQAIDVELPVQAPPTLGLRVPDELEALAGQKDPVSIDVTASDPPAAADLQVVAAAGLVLDVQETDAGLRVLWQPPSEPLPRAIPIAIRDARQPHRAPAWVTARMIGRPRVPIHTDPGAAVRLEVGGRSYGPETADAEGLAVVEAQLWPGEHSVTVVATDSLGNERRSVLELGGHVDPTLVLLSDGQVVPGAPMPDLYVGAFQASGQPWTGPAPRCRTGVNDSLGLAAIAPGSWVASLPPSASRMFDLKLECALDDKVVGDLRVPVDAAVPAVVRLRVWPPELAAEQPVAQVQAWLEGPTGDRLEADGLVLSARHGVLTPEEGPAGLVVSTYDGRDAVAEGGDEIEASWHAPPGNGAPWQLDLALAQASADGALDLLVEARGDQGRPVAGRTVDVDVFGVTGSGSTDASGQARIRLETGRPGGPWVVRARSGSISHSETLFEADVQGSAPASALAVPGLRSSVEVSIRSGIVQRAIIEARPDEIRAGGDDLARVIVDLRDRSGHPVTHAPVLVEANRGRVLDVNEVADGTYEAVYLPPPRLRYGDVDLTVSGQGGFEARTHLRVLPRRVRLAIGATAGWMYGASSISSPWAEFELLARLPAVPAPLFARLGIGGYLGGTTIADDGTGNPVDLTLGVLPIGASMLARAEHRRLAGWAGGGLVLAPYQLQAVYGDDVGVRGVGLAPPGAELLFGGGWRLGAGELQLQISWLSLSLPVGDVGWEGPVGGVRGGLGWKFVY